VVNGCETIHIVPDKASPLHTKEGSQPKNN
jgi:hypothetical protein